MIFPRIDIHTHDPSRTDSAIINISPNEDILPGTYYSMGIHPWDTATVTLSMLDALTSKAHNKQIVAIGETGLDALRGGEIASQIELFKFHIGLSEQLEKPLIIHAVRTFPLIIKLKQELKPRQPWIIHGFRGKPELAQELLRHGFYLSLGEKFNKETASIIPSDRLFYESDESPLPIEKIIALINASRDKLIY